MFLISTLLCRTTPDQTNPLSLDAFGVLVSLMTSLPNLFNSECPPKLPSGQGLELHCLKLCLLLYIMQVIYSLEIKDYKELIDIRGRTEENKLFDNIIPNLLKIRKLKVDPKKINPNKFYEMLEKASLPFLRCSALMFQHYTDVMPGSKLAKNGGRNYGPIAKYLGLPETIKQLLNNPASASVMQSLIDKDLSSDMDWETTEPSTISLPKFPLGFRKSTPQTKQLKKYFYPLAPLTTNVSFI